MTKKASKPTSSMGDQGTSIVGSAPKLKLTDKQSLRAWWHTILRNYGRYPCYAIFLVLQSDTDVLLYLNKYYKELQSLSGTNCLILALSEDAIRIAQFETGQWFKLMDRQAEEGYSIRVARLFEIDFTQFPCLLFFNDIRSPECVIVSMAGKDLYEIKKTMREKFSIIEKAVSQKENPLDLLEIQENVDVFRGQGKIIMGKIGNFTEKTLESIMEALINAVIK